jgi:hypothetical protein
MLRQPVRMTAIGSVAALAVALAPGVATAAGTQDYTCNTSGFNSSTVIGPSSFPAQSFPALSSGKLLSVELRVVNRVSSTTNSDIAVELYGEDVSGNLVAPLLASTTIPGATIHNDGFSYTYTANFNAANAQFLTAGERYGIALRTSDDGSNQWGLRDTNPCADGMVLGGGPPFTPLGGGAWDAGITTYLGPENDDFARATSLIAMPVSINGTSAGGTRESLEPDHYTIGPPGDPDLWDGDHTVWYRWTALGSGPTNVDTCTANIDSILAVYTGNALGALTRVTDNNNDPSCAGFGSAATFEANAGTTYMIAVGDAGGGRENTFTLDLEGPTNEAPEVTNLKPAPGAKITKSKPAIKAKVTDSASELDGGDVSLSLDGKKRAGATYNAAKDKLKFRKNLKPGKHEVEVEGTDEQALTGTETWSFKIKR